MNHVWQEEMKSKTTLWAEETPPPIVIGPCQKSQMARPDLRFPGVTHRPWRLFSQSARGRTGTSPGCTTLTHRTIQTDCLEARRCRTRPGRAARLCSSRLHGLGKHGHISSPHPGSHKAQRSSCFPCSLPLLIRRLFLSVCPEQAQECTQAARPSTNTVPCPSKVPFSACSLTPLPSAHRCPQRLRGRVGLEPSPPTPASLCRASCLPSWTWHGGVSRAVGVLTP